MDKNVKFEYIDGDAICTIQYKNQTFIGKAVCHPDDLDFESERTGLFIAETRAIIQGLRFQRECEIKPALNVLYHLYGNMATSKNFNPKSYEAKMIRSQIKVLENDLAAINADLANERKNLKEYIDKKDILYKKLRAKNQ